MTHLGRGLRVFAVMCVLASLLTMTAISSAAQDAGTPAATSTTTTETPANTDSSSTSTSTETTDPNTSPAPSPSADDGGTATETTDTGGDTADPSPTDTPTDPAADQGDTASPSPNPSPSDDATGQQPASLAVQDVASPAASPVDTVPVTIHAFLCATTDDSNTPATSCSGATGVGFAVKDSDDNEQNVTTGGDGTATVQEADGEAISVTVDTSTEPTGYTRLDQSSPTQGLTVDAKGTNEVDFIYVATAGTQDGKVQVVSISCPTTGDSHTTWRIIEPNTMRAAAALACGPQAGASYTFTGGDLGPDGLTVVTDDSGQWKGTLAPGTYTVTEDASSSSASITVEAIRTSVAIAVDYVHVSNTGTLAIQIFSCPAASDSTEINISKPDGDGSGAGANCALEDGSVTIDGANAIDVPGGAFNLTTIPEGSYTLKDDASGQTANFDIVTGETTHADIIHNVAMGDVEATALSCDAPVSTDQDTADAAFWQQNCTTAASFDLSLVDSNGNPVPLGLVPVGTYKIVASGADICAAFVNGSDASNGFEVKGGDTIEVTAFGCTRPSDTDTGGDSGDTNGSTSGGDGTGSVDSASQTDQSASSQTGNTGTTTVTSLPNTGAGAQGGNDLLPLGISLPLLALGAGAVAVERRRRRAA